MREFLFIADNLALDFVNTELISGGDRIDTLQTPADLRDWFLNARNVHGAWEKIPGAESQEWKELLTGALELRRALRAMATAIVNRQRIPRASIEAINAILSRVPLQREIAPAATGYQWVENLKEKSFWVLLYPIAFAAGDLLVQGKFDRVKKCNNPDCILFLYDTTRSHTRQWCSMAACGNRIKVAAFYQRQRAHRRRTT